MTSYDITIGHVTGGVLDSVYMQVLRILATQAMSQAEYFSTGSLSPDQFSHYGLALDHYTHFTSPIRRYADLIVCYVCMDVCTYVCI